MSALRYLPGLAAAILAQCVLTTAVLQPCSNTSHEVHVSPIISLDNSAVQFISCDSGHDGPRVTPINGTTYEWWYFDAVSNDGSEALTIAFFTASALGFPFQLPSAIDATTVAVFATFADGTTSIVPLLAEGATISTAGGGATGIWKGAGNFTGTPDLSNYHVSIDSPLLGPRGTLQLTSVPTSRLAFFITKNQELTGI